MGSFIFFFNDTATTEIYTLSLHDALPILDDYEAGRYATSRVLRQAGFDVLEAASGEAALAETREDRKSTRLNSSHANISYAVFCLKKKTTLARSVIPRCF